MKKQQKEVEKAAKKQQRQEQLAATEGSGEAKEDGSVGLYGSLPLIQSKDKPDHSLVHLKEIDGKRKDQKIWIRGRLFTSRSVGM